MKSFQFKNLLPHIIAIVVFLIVTLIFCKPALESGVILNQGDVTSYQGMSHQVIEYKNIHGHLPLWVPNMFCGMPGYQIALEGNWSPLTIINSIFQLNLPQPFNFFFLACISFYFLCICLRVRPFAAIIGALAFAFSSYSPIIISVGHVTKMLALAYAPAVMGAVILIFDRRYILGFTLTAILTAFQIGQGHQQISYYLFIVLIIMTISYLVYFIKQKEYAHILKSISLLIIAGIIAIANNALVLYTAFDYTKESKRGGMLMLDNKSDNKEGIKNNKTVGLTKDYAFMWSYGKAETWSLMFPGVMGYGLHQAEREGEVSVFPKLKDDSHLVKFVNENMPQFPSDQIASQMSGALYWGKQPSTTGPVYLGAIICFLFLLGMFYLDNKHKWWILIASVLAIMLSWGDNFPSFNYFIFDHLPFYNKFRAPTMILVIPQLLFPLIASLVINKLMTEEDENTWSKFKLSAITTLFVFALITVFYISNDFSKENKARTEAFNNIYKTGGADAQNKLQNLDEKYKPEVDNQIYENIVSNLSKDPNVDALKTSREFISALRKDRSELLLSDILRSLIYVLLVVGLIALFIKKKINATIMVVAVTLLSTIDLISFGMNYLNDKNYEKADDHEATSFPITTADKMIMNDTDPNFRVMNTNSMEESMTSYYHKSIGGYHPAKLGIYDDLIAHQFHSKYNMAVINMLNTKYFIQSQQNNDKIAQLNPDALGNVWFVKAIKFVNGPANEMRAITNFNPKDTAIVDESFKSIISAFTAPDSNSSIKMTSFDNDTIRYESNSTGNNVAVFSEIYYKDWNATIDGKKAEIFKTNYVLRGLVIPAGKHKIEFKFEPPSYIIGRKVSSTASWLLFIILIGTIAIEVSKKMKAKNNIT